MTREMTRGIATRGFFARSVGERRCQRAAATALLIAAKST
jgi:hypothetical protein